MDKVEGRPGGLSSLRDEAVPSSPKASIPDAVMSQAMRALDLVMSSEINGDWENHLRQCVFAVAPILSGVEKP